MTETTQKVGWYAYAIAGLSFIPVFGLLFGVIAIVWGLITRSKGGKRLVLVGLIGIAANVAIIFYTLYVGMKNDEAFFAQKQVGYERFMLNRLADAIEDRKQYDGSYPETREKLIELSLRGIIDFDEEISSSIFYQLAGGGQYFLFHVGSDNTPFTTDDISPNMDKSRPGYVLAVLDEIE